MLPGKYYQTGLHHQKGPLAKCTCFPELLLMHQSSKIHGNHPGPALCHIPWWDRNLDLHHAPNRYGYVMLCELCCGKWEDSNCNGSVRGTARTAPSSSFFLLPQNLKRCIRSKSTRWPDKTDMCSIWLIVPPENNSLVLLAHTETW